MAQGTPLLHFHSYYHASYKYLPQVCFRNSKLFTSNLFLILLNSKPVLAATSLTTSTARIESAGERQGRVRDNQEWK